MTSGSNASNALQLFHNKNLQMLSARTYSRLQSLYVVPSIQWTWDTQQAELLTQIRGKEVVLGGDARCDSPGYSAKYGSYTLIDLEANKVLDTNLVQVQNCNEDQGSTHMELVGLERCLNFLSRKVEVKALVTDRHSMVKKYMQEENSNTKHYFDVWHVAKGSVPYKLIKEVVASKFLMKDVPRLSPVHQTYSLEVFHSIVNHYAPKSTHFQYAAMTASNRPQATTQDSKLKFTTCYPKGKKGTVAVETMQTPTNLWFTFMRISGARK